MYVCKSVCVCMYVRMHVCVCMCVCVYVCMYVCVCMFVCMYLCDCVCVCVCVWVCTPFRAARIFTAGDLPMTVTLLNELWDRALEPIPDQDVHGLCGALVIGERAGQEITVQRQPCQCWQRQQRARNGAIQAVLAQLHLTQGTVL